MPLHCASRHGPLLQFAMHVYTGGSARRAQALDHRGLEEGRERRSLRARADLDLTPGAGHGHLCGDGQIVACRRGHVQQQGVVDLPLGDVVHVVEGEISLGGLRIHASVDTNRRRALLGIPDALPELRELIARHRGTLDEHCRQVERYIQVEDIQRVLDCDLQEERVRRLGARQELAGQQGQGRLGRRARCDVRHRHLLPRSQSEGVLVDLDRESVQRHRRRVGEGEVELDLTTLPIHRSHDTEACLAGLPSLRGVEDGHLRRRRRARQATARGFVRAAQIQEVEGAAAAADAAPVVAPSVQLLLHLLSPFVALFVVVLFVLGRAAAHGGGRRGAQARDELVRGLVVDAAHHGELCHKLVQGAPLDRLRVVADRGLVAENHILGRLGVGREQPPIDVAAVPDVVVIRLLCGELEHLGDHVLSLLGLLQKELHDAGEQLQLHHRGLVVEVVEEGIQDLINLVDALGILSQDPNHRGLGLRLVQFLQVVAERFEHLLVPRRVLAENVLDDDTGLLHDVVHLRLDQLQQHGDGPLAGALELHGDAADGAHGLPHEVYIDARGVLLEFQQDLFEVLLRDEHYHDVHLLQLDIHRVVVLAEEHLDVRGEDARTLLDDEANVPQDDILDLRLAREQGDQRRVQLLGQGAERLCVVDVLHAREDDLDGRQHHRGVGVRQPRGDALGDGLRIARARGHVHGEGVQDEDLAPLVALVEGRQELGDRGFVFQVQQVLS
mmetsp:Transcript_61830/g.177325  ORF Transcript_61830/g.177325 Transcript_61830/m.177325 type:complete len:728 (+) Transcript_61830:225-2408(+)